MFRESSKRLGAHLSGIYPQLQELKEENRKLAGVSGIEALTACALIASIGLDAAATFNRQDDTVRL